MDHPTKRISGVILAGGRGSRMNEKDKGLVELRGEALIAHVLRALRPQVGTIIISANRNLETYRQYDAAVVRDDLPGYQGPLAGMLAALDILATPFLMTVPCDGPYLAPSLSARLYTTLVVNNSDLAVAHDGERLHPVFSMMRSGTRRSLEAFLKRGERKIDRWHNDLAVSCADCSDIPECFINLNTPADIQAANKAT